MDKTSSTEYIEEVPNSHHLLLYSSKIFGIGPLLRKQLSAFS